MLSIYVIAAYSAAERVRGIHASLRALGYSPVSRWAEDAHGPEQLEALSDAQCYAIWSANYAALERADAAIVLADTPMREGFAESSYALRSGIDTVWVGRPTLMARAFCDRGVGPWFVESVDAALDALAGMVRR